MAEKVVRLIPWDECGGRLKGIVLKETDVFMDFGSFRIQLGSTEIAPIIKDHLVKMIGKSISPLKAEFLWDLEQMLRPLIGQRIAILRTDLPEKPYLLRMLAQEDEPTEQINGTLGRQP